MRLLDVLKLMYINDTTGLINIKIKEFMKNGLGRVLYIGKVKQLIEYLELNDNLNLNTDKGILVQTNNIHNFQIVEILIDKSIEEEKDLPDYNKGKIITIR